MNERKPFSKTEDFWAISIGALILVAALAIFFSMVPEELPSEIEQLEAVMEANPANSEKWNEAQSALKKLKLSGMSNGPFMKSLTSKPNSWTTNPMDAFFSEKGSFSFMNMGLLFLLLLILFGVGARAMGEKIEAFAKAFPFLFLLAFISLAFASQKDLKSMGIEYAVWAIFLGMLISISIGIPEWLKPALKTEFYIKTGLIIMGAEVLFNKMLAIGLPGMFVAWVVTPIVLITTFWFGQKVLK